MTAADPPSGRGYEPLTKPIHTPRAVRAAVRRWSKRLGFTRPWRIFVIICDSRKQLYCDDQDAGVYASCEPAHEYLRAILRFDCWHPGWEGEDLDEVVRHELLHAKIAPYTCAAQHNAAGDAVRAMLETAEEELVGRLSMMPVWDELEGEA